jgi:polyhydroxybutyrate depolymerase
MSQKTLKHVFSILTIISVLVGFGLAAVYFLNPVGALERGPRYVIFLWVCAVIGVVSSMAMGFFWVKVAKGWRVAKLYLLAIIALLIIGLSGFLYASYVDHQQYHTLTVNGVERQYLIFIPTTYSPSQPVPLLLVLHGGSGNAKQFQDQTGFNQIAQQEGFIVVYPDGLGTFKYSLHVWNSGYIKAASDMGTDDVGFLATLIENLEQTYSIDTSRIYLTGHSNGGMMTDRMAAEHPELFAAVAPVSSSIGGKATPQSPPYTIPTPSQPVTVIRTHGLQDQNVLYNGGYSQSGFQVGERYDDSENQSTTFWINNNKCQNSPAITNSTNGLITMERFTGGQNTTEVVLVTINGENHFWENMNRAVQSEQFNGGSLSEMIWNLLKEYAKMQPART